MGAAAIVMDHPFKKDVAEVAFAQRNEEVEALSPNGSNEPFAESVCLRTTLALTTVKKSQATIASA